MGAASEAVAGAHDPPFAGADPEASRAALEAAGYAGWPGGELVADDYGGERSRASFTNEAQQRWEAGDGSVDDGSSDAGDFVAQAADDDDDDDGSFDDDTDEEASYADDEAEDAETDAQAERAWRDEVGPEAGEAAARADEAVDWVEREAQAQAIDTLSAAAQDADERSAAAQAIDELSATTRPAEESTAEARTVDDLTAAAQAVDERTAQGVPVEARGVDVDEAMELGADDPSPDEGPRRVWRRERAGPRFFDNVDHRHKPRLFACVGASAYFSALARRYDVVGRCTFEESKHARRQYGHATSAVCEAPSFLGCRYENGIERFFYGYTRVLLRPRRSAAEKRARGTRDRAEVHRRDAARGEAS